MVLILLKSEKIILKGQKTKSDGFMYSVLAILGVLFLACIDTLVAWTLLIKEVSLFLQMHILKIVN